MPEGIVDRRQSALTLPLFNPNPTADHPTPPQATQAFPLSS